MACDGMGDNTLVSIVIFPAVDKNLFDQPHAFCFIRSTIDEKRSRFFLPNSSGSPRYLPVPPSFWIERASLIADLRAVGACREKLIEDFPVLIDCPEASSYRFSNRHKASPFSLLALRKNIVSSAKRRWLRRGHPRATRTPLRVPSSCALLHRPERTSLHKIKMYGERGSP